MIYKVKPESYFRNHKDYNGVSVRKGCLFSSAMFRYCGELLNINFEGKKIANVNDFFFELWMLEGFDENGNPEKILQPEFEF